MFKRHDNKWWLKEFKIQVVKNKHIQMIITWKIKKTNITTLWHKKEEKKA